jgi:hypothetical protein
MMATLGSTVMLFGGLGGSDSNTELSDTWTWNGQAWTMPSITNSPGARDSGIAVAMSGQIVLFGGQDINANALNDTWIWSGTDWAEDNDLVMSPPGRFAAGGAVLQGQFVLYGGTTNVTNDFNDTWIFDGTQWFAGPVMGPSTRAYVAMVGPG